MSSMADWLEDPLVVRKKGSLTFKQPKSLGTDARDNWEIFHFSTRLKLDAADHFCRLALGVTSMPYDFGLPLLARSQTKWYLDAFFFELMSAYETLLQELNVVYEVNKDVEKVTWTSIKGKLTAPSLKNLMESERKEAWFERLRWYRNTATHHAYIPISAGAIGWGKMPWDYDKHLVSLFYFDPETNEWKEESVEACPDYLKRMVEHIRTVWGKMAEEFD